jgi:hypothetical protein
MPNNVTNILKITGKNSKEILDSLEAFGGDEKNYIDFNLIIKMPESLKYTTSPCKYELVILNAIKGIKSSEKIKQVLMDLKLSKIATPEEKDFDAALTNFIYYGYFDWYAWSLGNWGTKWNSYNSKRLTDNTVKFQTAWSTPEQVIKKLSELYPKNSFTVRYADEDTGSNCGRYIYKAGDLLEDYSPGPCRSPAAKAYARRIY